MRWPRIILFAALLVFCATPWASPPIALALGLALALTIGNPFAAQTSNDRPPGAHRRCRANRSPPSAYGRCCSA